MSELENSFPEQEKPTKQQTPAASSFFEKLKTKWPVVLGVLGSIAIFAAIIYAAYSYGKQGQGIQPNPTPTPSPTLILSPTSPPTETPTPTVALTLTPALTLTSTPTPIVIATPTPEPTADWKTYRSTTEEYSPYMIKYPKEWSFKEEFAHGTWDLRVTFNNSLGKPSIVFVVSFINFKENFYASQKKYLGELKEVNISGKTGYMFDNKYGYLKGYYFPLLTGYFSLELLDEAEESTLYLMLSTFKFLE